MGVVVVVEELGHGVVVAAGQHAGGGFFGVDCGRPVSISSIGKREKKKRGNSHFFSYVGLPVVLGAKLPYSPELMTDDHPHTKSVTLPASPRPC